MALKPEILLTIRFAFLANAFCYSYEYSMKKVKNTLPNGAMVKEVIFILLLFIIWL